MLSYGAANPAPAPNPLFWFKADAGVYSDAGVSPANYGDTVQQWNDQSGNTINHDLTLTADHLKVVWPK